MHVRIFSEYIVIKLNYIFLFLREKKNLCLYVLPSWAPAPLLRAAIDSTLSVLAVFTPYPFSGAKASGGT